MSASAVLSSKALTGIDTIIAAVEPALEAKTFSVSSAVKEILQGNLSAREDSGGRPSPPVWQARAAVQLLQPWWQEDTLTQQSARGLGDDAAEFVSNLLTKIEDLWFELATTAGGDPGILDHALEELAAVSSSGVSARRTNKDAAVQAAMDLLSGLRYELRG